MKKLGKFESRQKMDKIENITEKLIKHDPKKIVPFGSHEKKHGGKVRTATSKL